MATKPKFNPDQPFDVVTKPAFDPNVAFEENITPSTDMSNTDVSRLESFGRGALQGASLGFSDELTGAGEAAGDVLAGQTPVDWASLVEAYKKNRDESRANYKAAEEAHPGYSLAGNIGGGLATSLIPGLGVAGVGANLSKTLLTGAKLGGAYGLGQSEADTIGGDLKETTKGAVAGAAGEALFKGAGHALSGLADTGIGQRVVKSFNLGDTGLSTVGASATAAARDAFNNEVGQLPTQVVKTVKDAGGRIGDARQKLSEMGFGVKGKDLLDETFDVLRKSDLNENQRNKIAKIANRVKEVVGNKEELTPADVTSVRKIFNNEIGKGDKFIADAVSDMSHKFSKLETEGIEELRKKGQANLFSDVSEAIVPAPKTVPVQPDNVIPLFPKAEVVPMPSPPVANTPIIEPAQTALFNADQAGAAKFSDQFLNDFIDDKKIYSGGKQALDILDPTYRQGTLVPGSQAVSTLSKLGTNLPLTDPNYVVHELGPLKEAITKALGPEKTEVIIGRIKDNADRLMLSDPEAASIYIKQAGTKIYPTLGGTPEKVANLMGQANKFVGDTLSAPVKSFMKGFNKGLNGDVAKDEATQTAKLGDYYLYGKTAKLNNAELAQISQNMNTSVPEEAAKLNQYMKTAMDNGADRIKRNAALYALMQSKTFRDTAGALTGLNDKE